MKLIQPLSPTVKWNNRGLEDLLRILLLSRGQDEWDQLLPQIMRAFRGTPHSTTGETANIMMLRRELRLPYQLQLYPPPAEVEPQQEYSLQMAEHLSAVHKMLREQQKKIRQEDQEEPLLFSRRHGLARESQKEKRRESQTSG